MILWSVCQEHFGLQSSDLSGSYDSWFWGQFVEGQGHCDLENIKLVWSITGEQVGLQSSDLVGRLVMILIGFEFRGHERCDLDYKKLVRSITRECIGLHWSDLVGSSSWPRLILESKVRVTVTLTTKKNACLLSPDLMGTYESYWFWG